MSKKLQVFVSSTFTDLIKERQAAVEAILEAGHIPAGMELFAAEDESQMDIIHEWIDGSDAFLLILCGRYGQLERKSEKSYTQLEWEYAGKQKKPRMAVVAAEEYLDRKVREAGRGMVENLHGEKLKLFRDGITGGLMCDFFDSIDRLKLAVLKSLRRVEKDDSLVGWVRGDQVVNLKETVDTINRLQNENASLRKQAEELQAFYDQTNTPWTVEAAAKKLTGEERIMLNSMEVGGGTARYSRGGSFFVANVNHLSPYTLRQEMELKDTAESLVNADLMEMLMRNAEQIEYRLTKKGFLVVDWLRKHQATPPAHAGG